MSLLLHLSDPHFGTEQARVMEALLRLVQAEPPTLVVLSGDITQRATPAQFAAARAFVDRLGPAPVLAIPGNHDIPLFNPLARLFWPYNRYRQAFGPALEPQFSSPEWLVLCTNTTRRWRHRNGDISPAQIERVATRLTQADARQLRLVVTHQPVAVTQPRDHQNLLRGHAQAVRRWSQAGADLVLGGHIHLPYVLPLRGQHPELPRALWAVQAGTAVSSRLRREAGNSVHRIRYRYNGQRAAEVERWDYDAHGGEFVCIATTDILPDAH